MFKLAGRVLDFYDDPDFVTNLTAQSLFGDKLYAPEEIHALPDKMFTVKIATRQGSVRKWPVFNKLAVRLSGEYFNSVAGELPEDLRNTAGFFLKTAHVRHGLSLPAALDQSFSQPESWLVELPQQDTTEIMRAPTIQAMTKQAQDDFLGSLREMSPETRFAQANAIFDLCKQAQVELDERIWDYVEKERFGPHLKEELQTRRAMIKEASGDVLAETFVQTLSEFTGHGLRKLAEVIASFDRQAGLDVEWDSRLRDPYEAVYGGMGMKKQASKESDLLNWKLQTLCMKPHELERIFEPLFVNQFLNDPLGSYKTASPLTKKIILSLVKKIPAPKTGEVKAHLTESYRDRKSTMPLDHVLESVGRDIAEGHRDSHTSS